ncbi:histidine kinase [Neptuniibacter sp.]|uniref:histidine kinase n=1 Tax=Neptuniibacter sp. TaxID=1962643 RepID=UPI00260C942F|nr:histidine kinase [Neptuniibacter sp.]MCP4595229.1 HAMP domain-containing protein [Neptuniibacter sp.]
MKTIRLNHLLMLIVLLSGVAALFLSAGIALYKSDTKSRQQAHNLADTVKQQLDWQWLKVENQVMNRDQFPDFYLWKNSASFAGLCLTFENAHGRNLRSLCRDDISEEHWPEWFETLYLTLFEPGKEAIQQVTFDNNLVGKVKVAPNEIVVLYQAWQNILYLMEVCFIIVLTLCILLYLSLRWILRPIRHTQKVLRQLEQGDLSARVPTFHVQEWNQTGNVINELASSLQETLDERKQLSLKLLHIQENERRHLCRELHDEFGQSLTGLRAIAYYLDEEAQIHCPELTEKIRQISKISQHMMELVKGLLFRLRPADIDELGLAESLHNMVDNWNSQHQGVHCELVTDKQTDQIPSPIAINLLRIVQESLTNIAKHASASEAYIQLQILTEQGAHSEQHLQLAIQDNGDLKNSDSLIKPGNGLLGIKERICALNGELELQTSEYGGLEVTAMIPLTVYKDADEVS